MKKFLLKCLVFFSIVIGIITFVLIFYGGNVDYFYEKFTTPKSKALVLGDSRSLQAIQPRVLNEYFKNSDLELPMLNYSFTLKQIAYGKPYTESIKRKLDTTAKNGLFIVTVHPFTLSNRSGNDEEEQGIFFEADMPPHNMEYVDVNPNYEYLYKNFNYFHFRGIFRKSSKTHKDGWLEEKNLPTDKKVLDKWTVKGIKSYDGMAKKWKKSSIRLTYLEELINYLKDYGTVFMVRLPVDNEVLKIEDRYWNNFNKDMIGISKRSKVNYINFSVTENQFKTYDGVHIDKFAGVPFTNTLCDSISKYIKFKKTISEINTNKSK